jgi:hypothetical protein
MHALIVAATLVAGPMDEGWKPAFLVDTGLGEIVWWLTMIGMVPLYASLILVLLLFTKALTSDRRYSIVGIAECVFACLHFLFALPLVQ